MKKFKCTVTKETIMEIEIDDSIWTPKEIKNWSKSFYSADNLEEVVEYLAKMKSEHEDGEYIEGFGIPMINGHKPYSYLSDDDMNNSTNIRREETYMDVEITKI